MACLLVVSGFTGTAVEGHMEHGQRINVNDAVCDEPFSATLKDAASVVPPSGGSIVAVAANEAVEAPALTLTEAGTINAGMVDEIGTVIPPVGATSGSVTVQLADAPALSVVALQVRAETT